MNNQNEQSSSLLKKPEAAAYLKISQRTLDNWIQLRRVPYYKLGNGKNASVRFKRADLDMMLDQYRVDSVFR